MSARLRDRERPPISSSRSRNSAPATPCCSRTAPVGRTGTASSSPATSRCCRRTPSTARSTSTGPTGRGHRPHGRRRAALRLRPHRPHRRPDRADRRGTRRVAGRARRSRKSTRHLRLRPRAALRRARSIASQNTQGEYYLPDLDRDLSPPEAAGRDADASRTPARFAASTAARELAEVGAIVRQTRNEELMAAGVTMIDPATTYVEPDVEVGADTVIHPERLPGRADPHRRACEIHAGARIVDSTIGDRVTILNYCIVIEASRSPTAPSSARSPICGRAATCGRGRKVGNFVELKKTMLGEGSKANHLTYLGDATIGADVNIGAGTITCNYDGVDEAPDGHRRRRVHRQRFAAGGAGDDRRGRLRRRRVDDHRGRAGRGARHRARPAGEQGRLGRATRECRPSRAAGKPAGGPGIASSPSTGTERRAQSCAESSATSERSRSSRS